MTELSRRTALKRAGALAATAIAAGWLRPGDALAEWNKERLRIEDRRRRPQAPEDRGSPPTPRTS